MATPDVQELRLTPKQGEAFQSVYSGIPNTGFIGGLGSGKTVVGTAIALSLLQRYPGIRLLLVAPTYDQISQGSLLTFLEWCPPAYIRSHNRTEHIIQFVWADEKGNPSELVYRSTSEIDRIRAHEYAACWWDESSMSPENARSVIRGRLRSKRGVGKDWHYPIFETTTPRGRNHLWRAYGPEQMPGETAEQRKSRLKRFRMVHATTYDNASNLPPDYIDQIEASMHGDEQLRQQELEGLFVAFEGLVYPQFSEQMHVRPLSTPDPVPWESAEVVKRVAGVDFGGGDPTAVVILGIGRSGKVHQYAERVWNGPTAEAQIAEFLFEWHNQAYLDHVWCDPSNQTAIATLRAAGLPAGPQTAQRGSGHNPSSITARAINDRAQGIRLVGDYLSRRMLTFNPNCTQSISEFYSYLYKEQTDGTGNRYRTSTPIDHHADCFVAGTLVTTRRGQVPIESIRADDEVLTRDGWRSIVLFGKTRNLSEVVTATLSDGKTLTGTPDHPVWVEGEGWVELGALRYGDILMSCSSSGTGTTTPRPGGGVTGTRPGGATDPRSIATCGRSITDPSLKGGKSTTSTTIPTTTTSVTSSRCQSTNIAPITASLRSEMTSRRKLEPLPLNGIAARPAADGTASMGGASGRRYARLRTAASNAAQPSSRGRSPSFATARTYASLTPDELQAWTTSAVFAPSARRSSPSIATRRSARAHVSVVSVSAVPRLHQTYNLTVADTPEFYANGVLVHNCMDARRYALMGSLTFRGMNPKAKGLYRRQSRTGVRVGRKRVAA